MTVERASLVDLMHEVLTFKDGHTGSNAAHNSLSSGLSSSEKRIISKFNTGTNSILNFVSDGFWLKQQK